MRCITYLQNNGAGGPYAGSGLRRSWRGAILRNTPSAPCCGFRNSRCTAIQNAGRISLFSEVFEHQKKKKRYSVQKGLSGRILWERENATETKCMPPIVTTAQYVPFFLIMPTYFHGHCRIPQSARNRSMMLPLTFLSVAKQRHDQKKETTNELPTIHHRRLLSEQA